MLSITFIEMQKNISKNENRMCRNGEQAAHIKSVISEMEENL